MLGSLAGAGEEDDHRISFFMAQCPSVAAAQTTGAQRRLSFEAASKDPDESEAASGKRKVPAFARFNTSDLDMASSLMEKLERMNVVDDEVDALIPKVASSCSTVGERVRSIQKVWTGKFIKSKSHLGVAPFMFVEPGPAILESLPMSRRGSTAGKSNRSQAHNHAPNTLNSLMNLENHVDIDGGRRLSRRQSAAQSRRQSANQNMFSQRSSVAGFSQRSSVVSCMSSGSALTGFLSMNMSQMTPASGSLIPLESGPSTPSSCHERLQIFSEDSEDNGAAANYVANSILASTGSGFRPHQRLKPLPVRTSTGQRPQEVFSNGIMPSFRVRQKV